jgi:hypothetical protein
VNHSSGHSTSEASLKPPPVPGCEDDIVICKVLHHTPHHLKAVRDRGSEAERE